MAPKAMDARKRVDRNRRFRVRLRERDRKWLFKPKRVPFQERKRSDVNVLSGSDPTTPTPLRPPRRRSVGRPESRTNSGRSFVRSVDLAQHLRVW